ncbi:methyltransferase domain-containing protein [Devosia sp. XJ19-1]|uniref:Methyltransferase domain-containing protein n=1 Tax=Devosia ureilytica TaxID=2952754 RepID=A0A9Q4AP85_9HYPH|nr:class I SAM-dependent methyltransferase [Devosia ureilytica]MCP8883984.1 methyltransferase domain-containing protein [Devosia ureilytica]MCP8887592.1 methyltransferase domain-containing protein [Devosia ureilytica]
MSGMQAGKQLLNAVHGALIFGRRVRAIADALAEAIPDGPGRVLDLGCGDGQVAVALMQRRADLRLEGVDVLVRPVTHIPVTQYDGSVLPFADRSFDHVTIVDVLHHTDDPAAVLAEAARVARLSVVVKDHLREGVLAGPTLRLMDWVGNRGHDVRLPYNYLDSDQWAKAFERAGLAEARRQAHLRLYPAPLSWAFERNLHFVSRLEHSNRS